MWCVYGCVCAVDADAFAVFLVLRKPLTLIREERGETPRGETGDRRPIEPIESCSDWQKPKKQTYSQLNSNSSVDLPLCGTRTASLSSHTSVDSFNHALSLSRTRNSLSLGRLFIPHLDSLVGLYSLVVSSPLHHQHSTTLVSTTKCSRPYSPHPKSPPPPPSP